MVGRLGNLLFIYAFARAYCEQHGYDLCLPPWIGEKIFKIPRAVSPSCIPDIVMPEVLYQNQESLIYTRKQVREWFQIKDEWVEKLQPAKTRQPVLLNVRRGADYLSAGLVCLGTKCYVDAAGRFGYSPNNCDLEVDTHSARLPDFEGDISASGLGTTWVGLPSFYKLMTAPVLFRANSTFSWWAATLSHGDIYSPIIKGLPGGVPDQYAEVFVKGNWPVMADNHPNTDLHLKEE